MRVTVILRYIGTALLLIALFEFAAACIAFYDGRDSSFVPLAASCFLSFVTGIFPRLYVRPVNSVSRQESSFIVLGAWLISCIFGTFPYLFWGEMSPVDALFESVSGFTTTGASILEDIEALPRGLLFWRMTTSWIGGFGIIVFATLLLPSMGRTGATLSRVESSALAIGGDGGKSSAYPVLAVYMVLTLSCTVVLHLSGMNWFDSINHAMSTISTCGFSTRNASIGYYGSNLIYSVIIAFMFISGINFSLLWAWARRRRNPLRTDVVRWYGAFVIICTIITSLSLIRSGRPASKAVIESAFHVVSLTTTTGFAVADTNTWPSLCMSVLLFCSIICACSGSTTGGMKMDRFLIATKTVRNHLQHVAQPNTVRAIKSDGSPVSDETVRETMVFVVIYVGTLFLGYIINAACGMDTTSALTASIACLGNVGPGFGSVGSLDNYAHLPMLVKVSSSALMLMGRLEIIGVVRIFSGRI